MKDYNEMISEVKKFSQESGIQPWDLQRIAKAMCCCGTCKYFVQHYAKVDGHYYKPIDWGHCDHGNIQKSKKISTASCGQWAESDVRF